MSTWELMLLKWCNCLELSAKIQNFDDLRTGEFFKNLLSVIVETHDSHSEENIFKHVIDLLNKTYCNVEFEFDCCSSFSKVTKDELITLTSLLMHYTCIYDRRDVLTSPLCHRLSRNTQLCIKNFLQMVNREISSVDLIKVIQEVNNDKHNDSFNSLSVNDALSPLTGVFETPVNTNSKFYAKDKQITKLKTALELEKFEKADLQEELKIQVDKNKKLEILLDKRNADVGRLKKELTLLECRTPPHFKPIESSDVEKRLKMEIQSLENYVEKMEKEHEELREECLKNTKKLSASELELQLLHAKCLEQEKQLEESNAICVKQSAEITSLESYCDELRGLLEEFQSKPSHNESSYFETSLANVTKRRSLVEVENLAGSVVEVQLKDAQKLNKELTSKIECLTKEIETKKVIFETKVEEYENKYSKMNDEFGKMIEMKLNIQELKNYFSIEMEKCKDCIQLLKQAMVQVIENYEESFSNFQKQLQTEREDALSLRNKWTHAMSELQKCNEELRDCNNKNTTYVKCIEVLQNNLDNTNEQKNILSSELENSLKLNEKYVQEISYFTNTVHSYKYEIDLLENEKNLVCSKEPLESNPKDSFIANSKSHNEVFSLLKECIVVTESLKNKLITYDGKNKEYSSEIESLRNIIKKNEIELNVLISENNQRVEQLENVLDCLRCEKETNLANIEALKKELEIKSTQLELNDKQFVELKNRCNKLKCEVSKLQQHIREIKLEFDGNFKETNNSMKTLNETINEIVQMYQECTKSLQAEIVKEKSASRNLTQKLMNASAEIDEFKTEINQVVAENEEYIKSFEKITQENTSLILDIERIRNQRLEKIDCLESIVSEKVGRIEYLEKLNEEYKTKNCEIVNENSQFISWLKEARENNERLSCEINKIKNEKTQLEKSVEEIYLLKKSISEKNEKIQCLENVIAEQMKEITGNLESNENLKKEILEKQRGSNISRKLMNEYKNKCEKLQIEIRNLNEGMKEIRVNSKKEFNETYSLFKQLTIVISQIKHVHQNSTETSRNEILNEQLINSDLSEKISKLISEIAVEKSINDSLSQKLSQVAIDSEKSKEKIDELLIEKNRLIRQIEDLNKDKQILVREIEETKREIETLKTNIGDLESNYSQKNKEISECHSKLELQNNAILDKDKLINEIDKKLRVTQEESEIKIEFSKSSISSLKNQLRELKMFCTKELKGQDYLLDKMKKSLQVYNDKFINTEKYIEELKKTVDEYEKLNLKSNEFKNEIDLLQKQLSDIKEEKNNLLKDNKSIQDDYIGLIKTISMYNEELNKLVKNMKKQKEKSDSEILDRQLLSYTLSEPNSPLRGGYDKTVDEIHKFGKQLSKLNAYVFMYSDKETCYLKEIEELKKQLSSSSETCFELRESLREQNSENEFQARSLTENLHSVIAKYNQLQSEHSQSLKKIEDLEEVVSDLKKTQNEMKESNEIETFNLQDSSKNKIKEISDEYNVLIQKLQKEISERNDEIEELKKVCKENESTILNLRSKISMGKEEISQLRQKYGRTAEEHEMTLAKLQVQVVSGKFETTELGKKYDELVAEKEHLLNARRKVEAEKESIENQLTEERNSNMQLRNKISEAEGLLKELEKYQNLKEKYQQCQEKVKNVEFLEGKQVELQQKIDALMNANDSRNETYDIFKTYYKQFKESLDKLLSQKNILETLTNKLRVSIINLNKNILPENSNLRKLVEKREALEVIAEDIMKQYNRYSKQTNDIVFDIVNYYEKNCDSLLTSLNIKVENYLEKYDLGNLIEEVSDLSEKTTDALEQVKELQRDLTNLNKAEVSLASQKENVLGSSNRINVDKMKEEELKKKNLALRQKVILLENEKRNFEKTVKKLRDENKKIKTMESISTTPDNDVHYKTLLQQYIEFKENHEKILQNHKIKFETLQKEFDEHKAICMRSSTPFNDQHYFPSESDCNNIKTDLEKLREAYASIRIINEKLENENVRSKNTIEDQKHEIYKFQMIKEAYDKLLEENNKLMTDVDTIKYKRARDRDEFLRLLKKERNENDVRNSKQIQAIKTDYEAKLERMKDKMIKLYREEVNNEMRKVKSGQHESASLLKVIEQLKGDLFEAEQKIHLLDMEREILRRNQDQLTNYSLQRESLSSIQFRDSDTRSLKDFPTSSTSSALVSSKPRPVSGKLMEFKHPSKVNPSSLDTRRHFEERRASTLPRTGTVIEEVVTVSRTSFGVTEGLGQNLQMEDEEEMFNNKYLADLKQGKCDLPPSEDAAFRVSELAWRNSMVPPHLKSSYPAEMQFFSPERFKEDDLKSGSVPFEDSLCKLLPGDKPRKKDFGTTSYKKPGPPTPSKNGGRLSLQGNEVHPIRETYTEQKKSTPSRIKALFTGRSSSRSNNEVTSPKRRLNIFRR